MLVVIIAVVIGAVVYIARDTAPGIAKAYIQAINDGDCAKARSVVVPDLAEQTDNSCGQDTAENGKYDIRAIQFTMSGPSATVQAQLSRSDGTMTVIFTETKESGSWLIENLESS